MISMNGFRKTSSGAFRVSRHLQDPSIDYHMHHPSKEELFCEANICLVAGVVCVRARASLFIAEYSRLTTKGRGDGFPSPLWTGHSPSTLETCESVFYCLWALGVWRGGGRGWSAIACDDWSAYAESLLTVPRTEESSM